MLRLPDRWLWDFWFADDGADRHVFYLQAPRSLGDPDRRHANATIGHAISHDLRSWRVLPDALGPGPPGAWDDRATWTGSIVGRRGSWWMYYTGTTTAEDGAVQRIGAATSADLMTWRKHPANPLIEAASPWYQTSPTVACESVAWRDPWVVLAGERARCYITATAIDGPPDGRGVIALATSADLVHWTVAAPAYAPGEFDEMEVPQTVRFGEHSYLLFSVPAASHGERWTQRTGWAPRTGVYYAVADAPHGPFAGYPRSVDIVDGASELYAGKFVTDVTGGMAFIAARFHHHPDGEFVGELIDPIPIDQTEDGRLLIR